MKLEAVVAGLASEGLALVSDWLCFVDHFCFQPKCWPAESQLIPQDFSRILRPQVGGA